MELDKTINLMTSDSYKDRFAAEYFQTLIRLEKLAVIYVGADNKSLDFELTCPISILEKQLIDMNEYLNDLKSRAKIECIDLDRYEKDLTGLAPVIQFQSKRSNSESE